MRVNGDCLVAIGTFVLAGFTGWLAYETQRLANGTGDLVTDSERATAIASQSFRDSERPILVGEIMQRKRSDGPGSAYTLRVTNVGRGPALHVFPVLVPVQGNTDEFRAKSTGLSLAPTFQAIMASPRFVVSERSLDLQTVSLPQAPSFSLNGGGHDFVGARVDYLDMSGKEYTAIFCYPPDMGKVCVPSHD